MGFEAASRKPCRGNELSLSMSVRVHRVASSHLLLSREDRMLMILQHCFCTISSYSERPFTAKDWLVNDGIIVLERHLGDQHFWQHWGNISLVMSLTWYLRDGGEGMLSSFLALITISIVFVHSPVPIQPQSPRPSKWGQGGPIRSSVIVRPSTYFTGIQGQWHDIC